MKVPKTGDQCIMLPRILTKRRVGILGLYASGKTVFLTSLINHLSQHNPGHFRIGRPGANARIIGFQPRPADGRGRQFEYRYHREKLVNEWPEKTSQLYQYACQFQRSDQPYRIHQLQLFDLPGERLADLYIAGMTYDQWSVHMTTDVLMDHSHRQDCKEFIGLIEQDQPDTKLDEENLVQAYKVGLARMILNYKPYVSPSVFFLDRHGKLIEKGELEQMAADRLVGLDRESEFVPLPQDVCRTHPALATTFAERYRRYKDGAVLPLFQALKSCHSLIVLVDVAMLLAGGVGRYNDNRQLIEDTLKVLHPGRSSLPKVLQLVLGPGRVSRIAFVAPKLDIFPPVDRGKVENLLRDMLIPIVNNYPGLDVKYFTCGAAVSMQPKDDKDLNGRNMVGDVKEEGQRRTKVFTINEIPTTWADRWEAKTYSFPTRIILPHIPQNRGRAPRQINLDRVFEFVLA